VFGCCGFLSFSLVFCRFGGRLETTLYIHFIRRWVKSRRHSSASRENEDEKKAEKNAILRSWALWGGGGFAVCGGVFLAGLALWRLFGGFLGCRVWLGMSLRIGGGLRSVCRYGG
jgi:hypothetical protein